jgi:hypothetical protein
MQVQKVSHSHIGVVRIMYSCNSCNSCIINHLEYFTLIVYEGFECHGIMIFIGDHARQRETNA